MPRAVVASWSPGPLPFELGYLYPCDAGKWWAVGHLDHIRYKEEEQDQITSYSVAKLSTVYSLPVMFGWGGVLEVGESERVKIGRLVVFYLTRGRTLTKTEKPKD